MQTRRETVRTLADYRPQHDEECQAIPVTLDGDGASFTSCGRCTCGLDALLVSLRVEQGHRSAAQEKEIGAGLAAGVSDTGCSQTETASDDARICPQDGKVCWEPGCEVEYCKGRYEGREAAFEEITAHWFLQGGQSEFGFIGKDKIISGDSLIADILKRVRALARPAAHIPANDSEWQQRMKLAVEGWLHPVSSTPAASPAQKDSDGDRS